VKNDLLVVLVSLLTGGVVACAFYLGIRRHEDPDYSRRLAIAVGLGLGGIIAVSRLDLPSKQTYWSIGVIAACLAVALLAIRRSAEQARLQDSEDVRVQSDDTSR
jgi:hypothetical protein